MKSKKRILLYGIAIILFIGIIGVLFQIIVNQTEQSKMQKKMSDLQQQVIDPTPENLPVQKDITKTNVEKSEPTTKPITPKEQKTINISEVLTQYDNAVGWIAQEDTQINYPIMQSDDNVYYMDKLFDDTRNQSGSIFLDYRNADDFSDGYSIIYGHNMKNQSMFGTLSQYHEQSYYKEHPEMFLYQENDTFRLVILAGMTVPEDSFIYTLPKNEAEKELVLQEFGKQTTFISDDMVSATDKLVILSTCVHNQEDSRYVVLGKLVK